ncbi:putative nitric oxide synthase [Nymphaea colorata]|nr:putative nitric oxide synthase [Nymphaea colorata]XP_031484258.1 putative nitric oxide synthase [Nymphaea colorata]
MSLKSPFLDFASSFTPSFLPRAPPFLIPLHGLRQSSLCSSSSVKASSANSETQRRRASVSDGEPTGTGAAAPTRGEVFLHRLLSQKPISGQPKKKEKKNKGAEPKRVVDSGIASCYGCGAPLQTQEVDAPGYVDPQTYEVKKRHRQLRTVLCGRCILLSHGHMVTAVGGNGGYAGGKQFITAEELREKLCHLRTEKVLIVKLVDIVDFNGSFLARIRDIAGANPIILVITKVDLLPKGTDLNCVGDWIVEATMKKKLNVLSIHLTSSKSLLGIEGVAVEIQKEKKGRDVYILGSANVGKSAFVNALLQMMARKDPVAAAARKYKPMQSAVPGTTLGPIEIDAFHGGGKLYDTPGVHLHHRQAAVVHSEDLPSLAPQSHLRGQCFPASFGKEAHSDGGATTLNGSSIFWGGLVRIDILKVFPHTRLTLYGPKALHSHMVPTVDADDFYKRELGVLLTPPNGKERADSWPGLQSVRRLQIKFEDWKRPACDIAVSGLGWIVLEPMGISTEFSDLIVEDTPRELHLTIHVPKPVEVFIRPPMPVGKAGAEWYMFQDLTEKQIEMRPKLCT